MQIVEELETIINELDNLQEYLDDLNNKLSFVDSKICDLEHFIEFNNINSKNAYRIIKEMKSVLLERRKIKNDMELSRVITQNINKLISKEHRKFLNMEVHKTSKRFKREYNNRVYKEDEENYLLGKEVNDEKTMERGDSNIVYESSNSNS